VTTVWLPLFYIIFFFFSSICLLEIAVVVVVVVVGLHVVACHIGTAFWLLLLLYMKRNNTRYFNLMYKM